MPLVRVEYDIRHPSPIPAAWSAEELDAYFIVRDGDGRLFGSTRLHGSTVNDVA
jgi:hypothetical protein